MWYDCTCFNLETKVLEQYNRNNNETLKLLAENSHKNLELRYWHYYFTEDRYNEKIIELIKEGSYYAAKQYLSREGDPFLWFYANLNFLEKAYNCPECTRDKFWEACLTHKEYMYRCSLFNYISPKSILNQCGGRDKVIEFLCCNFIIDSKVSDAVIEKVNNYLELKIETSFTYKLVIANKSIKALTNRMNELEAKFAEFTTYAPGFGSKFKEAEADFNALLNQKKKKDS